MVNKFLYQEGCHPAKMFLLPWVQIPLWIVISLSLRDIAGIFPGCEGMVSTCTLDFVGFLFYMSSSSSAFTGCRGHTLVHRLEQARFLWNITYIIGCRKSC